jgi:hypothetical protein
MFNNFLSKIKNALIDCYYEIMAKKARYLILLGLCRLKLSHKYKYDIDINSNVVLSNLHCNSAIKKMPI